MYAGTATIRVLASANVVLMLVKFPVVVAVDLTIVCGFSISVNVLASSNFCTKYNTPHIIMLKLNACALNSWSGPAGDNWVMTCDTAASDANPLSVRLYFAIFT